MDSNESNLMSLLDDLTVFEQVHELGDAFNIFEAVGMYKQEIRHSRFLAFLLNPLASHGLGDYFLRKFLDHVMMQYEAAAMTRLEVMLADLSSAEVYAERDHFDITVWLPKQKLLLVIENKIGASESVDQLRTYRERVKSQYPEETFCGVFLTAEGYGGEDNNWIAVGYATIYNQLQTLLNDPMAAVKADVLIVIKHYSQLIRKYIVTDEKLIEACRTIYAMHRAALNLIIEHGQISLLRESAKRFLESTPELELSNGGNDLRVNMAGTNWKNVSSFQIANITQWMSDYPLAFWFSLDEKKSMLTLFLEVGPVKKDSNFDRTELVLKLRKEFGVPVNRAISDIYTRIKRYNKGSVDTEDIDSIMEAMKKLWADFGGSDKLRSIDLIIQDTSKIALAH